MNDKEEEQVHSEDFNQYDLNSWVTVHMERMEKAYEQVFQQHTMQQQQLLEQANMKFEYLNVPLEPDPAIERERVWNLLKDIAR